MHFFKAAVFSCLCSALALPATDPKATAKPAKVPITQIGSPAPAALGDKAASDARAQYARTIYNSVQQIISSLVFGAGANSITPEQLNAETFKNLNSIKQALIEEANLKK